MVSTIYLFLHALEAERDNIRMTTSAPVHPANSPIPIDLFVSKKQPGLPRGVLGFADSSGKIVFRINRQSSQSSADDRTVLLDSAGNPLISIYGHHDGSWQGFNGDDGKKDLVFKVQRVSNKFTRTELEVFLGAENQGELTCDFKVKGCHFQRSCTIYKGDSLVAQTSLMHKLRQIILTIMPQKSGWREIWLQGDDGGMAAEMVICDGGQLAMILGGWCNRTKLKTETEIFWRKEREQGVLIEGNLFSSMQGSILSKVGGQNWQMLMAKRRIGQFFDW
ncbi:Uncharacterized protein TCM_042248 [Theobroma cacao]|uniref:Uncharacterized protein n=1 Tax=Theobroma cacao TaxID=3641 RepID=A0A061GXR6_THECC|nr:Uncharacterized protein TCM_042248 [Theobroma cacao]